MNFAKLRQWRRPVQKVNQPRDDGRGRLVSTSNDINLQPDIPVGITGFITDRSFGFIGPDFNSEWPVHDDWVVIPHLYIQRSIATPVHQTQWTTKSSFDDSIGIGSVFVGNPLG